jgi:hypothetical protein
VVHGCDDQQLLGGCRGSSARAQYLLCGSSAWLCHAFDNEMLYAKEQEQEHVDVHCKLMLASPSAVAGTMTRWWSS